MWLMVVWAGSRLYGLRPADRLYAADRLHGVEGPRLYGMNVPMLYGAVRLQCS
jgi:hypothetical protein